MAPIVRLAGLLEYPAGLEQIRRELDGGVIAAVRDPDLGAERVGEAVSTGGPATECPVQPQRRVDLEFWNDVRYGACLL